MISRRKAPPFTRLNKAFDSKLDALLKELAEEVSSDAG